MSAAREADRLCEPLDLEWRTHAFPWLPPERILYRDDAIVVVDKPGGVACQPLHEGDRYDLPSRIRQTLGGADAYLGVHQRLDRDTSGVMVYVVSPAANRALARQFEHHEIQKRYLAVVEDWRGPVEITLRDRLRTDPEGLSRVASDGALAVTRVRVSARTATRTLLEIELETGRTHQIRAQLAHRGAPIVGDPWYGGSPASRMMLHASELRFRHPIHDDSRVYHAQPPREMEAEIDPNLELGFDAPLSDAIASRLALAHSALAPASERTTAFRLVHQDRIPDAAIDVYADWFLVHLYADGFEPSPLIESLRKLDPAGIYIKARPRQANEIASETLELAPSEPVYGEPAPPEFVIREHGVPFAVRLGDGLSTGLFLDQRDNRARVRAASSGKRVLNLFSYTCAFSVAAALGGASETLSIDASGAALDRGRLNFELSGVDPSRHRTVRADVFDWMNRAIRRGERFDLVICDPPTYSAVKRKRGSVSRWTSGSGWTELARRCAELLVPGGTLLATSNDRRMTQPQFRRFLKQSEAFETARDLRPPTDFRHPFAATLHGIWAEKR